MMRSHLAAVACIAGLAVGSPATAQDDQRAVRILPLINALQPSAGALSERVVANAPFSADATTTVTQTLGDGTRIEQKTTTKLYRDSTGRVRREQTVIGLDRLNPSAQPQTTITFDSVPGDPSPYTLNPAARTARRAPRGVQWNVTGSYFSNGPGLTFRQRDTATATLANSWIASDLLNRTAGLQTAAIPSDLKPTEEQLGTRQVEGVKATGKRTTIVIPAGRLGNDRPIQITDEQWESPELQLLVASRFSDPRTGVVDYRMTDISRVEPRADLFAVPAGYTEVGGAAGRRGGDPAAQPAQPGGRGGRRGGGAQ